MEGAAILGMKMDDSVAEKSVNCDYINSDIYQLENKCNMMIGSKTESRSQKKITALLEKMPELNEIFHVHYKVGEGTFSTVYKASLRKLYMKDKQQYAIKHLVPTSNPARIGQELRCLADIGGKDNVVGLVRCLRKDDNIVFIMPYLPHEKFSTYMLYMDVDEVKLYMKNLLMALRRVHSFNIIHRDVKPNNFLYDRVNKKFLLVDFGLAEEVKKENTDSGRKCDNITVVSKKRKRSIVDEIENGSLNDIAGQPLKKRQALQPLTNTVNNLSVFKRPSTVDVRSHTTVGLNLNVKNNIAQDKTDTKQPETSTNNLLTTNKQINNDLLSPKRQPLSSNSVNVQNNISPQKLPRVNLFNTNNNNSNIAAENRGSILTNNSSNSMLLHKQSKTEEKSAARVFQSLMPSKINSGSSFLRVQNSQIRPVFTRPLNPTGTSNTCSCDGKSQVCSVCISRKRQTAPRAGTPGFRPPEVLLKHPHQTTAVDMWAAGVIFLSIVSGCYPFFRSPDDITALAEIISMFGTTAIKKIAAKYGKKLHCNLEKEGENLRYLCERLRRRREEAVALQSRNETAVKCLICGMIDFPLDGCSCKETEYVSGNGLFPDSAYDLLNRMLDLDPDNRITAADALNHPFLADCDS